MDVVAEAGLDISDWGNYARGVEKASTNPKYCYEWAFVDPGTVVLLNVWYDDIRDDRGVISLTENYRLGAAFQREAGGNSVWLKRSERFDDAVRIAASDELPIRAVICDGKRRAKESFQTGASRVHARELDPVPWAVTAYDPATGSFTMTRGALPHLLVDQFAIDGTPDSPTETRDVTGRVFVRDAAVRHNVLSRAQGRCEWCRRPGFTMHDGSVFLETHHVIPLSEKGRDTVQNVVALCPNHHREAHYGASREVMRKRLIAFLARSSS